MIKMQFITFATFDEFVEMIETRFSYARIDIDDELRTHIENVNANNSNAIAHIEFDVLHAFIETNLRQCVARHYMRELMKRHENEFINMHAFANEQTFHHFDIVVIDENERVSQFAHIYVNDDATIRVES